MLVLLDNRMLVNRRRHRLGLFPASLPSIRKEQLRRELPKRPQLRVVHRQARMRSRLLQARRLPSSMSLLKSLSFDLLLAPSFLAQRQLLLKHPLLRLQLPLCQMRLQLQLHHWSESRLRSRHLSHLARLQPNLLIPSSAPASFATTTMHRSASRKTSVRSSVMKRYLILRQFVS